MTVEEFINQIDSLTQAVQPGPDGAWGYAAQQTAEWLKAQVGGNTASQITYQFDGSLLEILAPSYLLYQNYGVQGAIQDRSGARPDEFEDNRFHKYNRSTPEKKPPHEVFSRYTTNVGQQYAISTNIYKFGIKPKGWFNRDGLTAIFTAKAEEFIQNNTIAQ